MTSSILHDPTFPHGTPEGFRLGCRGGACPSPVTCKHVHTRYNGDYSFRKQFDAGISAVEIVRREEEAAAAARAAEKAARIRANKVAMRTPRPKRPAGLINTTHQADVAEHHAKGLTDKQIGEALGKTREQIRAIRRVLGLPVNPTVTLDVHIRRLHAEGLDDGQIAQALQKEAGYVGVRRRRMGLPRNFTERRRVALEAVRQLHAEGLTDIEMTHRLGVDRRVVPRMRRKLELPPNKPLASPGVSSSQESA